MVFSKNSRSKHRKKLRKKTGKIAFSKTIKLLVGKFSGKSWENFRTTLRKIRDLTGNSEHRFLANPWKSISRKTFVKIWVIFRKTSTIVELFSNQVGPCRTVISKPLVFSHIPRKLWLYERPRDAYSRTRLVNSYHQEERLIEGSAYSREPWRPAIYLFLTMIFCCTHFRKLRNSYSLAASKPSLENPVSTTWHSDLSGIIHTWKASR